MPIRRRQPYSRALEPWESEEIKKLDETIIEVIRIAPEEILEEHEYLFEPDPGVIAEYLRAHPDRISEVRRIVDTDDWDECLTKLEHFFIDVFYRSW